MTPAAWVGCLVVVPPSLLALSLSLAVLVHDAAEAALGCIAPLPSGAGPLLSELGNESAP